MVYSGTLTDCKRVAFSLGLELGEYEGRCLGFEGRHATYAPADRNNFNRVTLKTHTGEFAGFIVKGQDDYGLVTHL